MVLYRIIYSSYASPSLGYEDLKEIMEKSQSNNSRDGITGFLCYRDSMFLQVLEGDRQIVSKTYHRIAQDKRHHNPEIIEAVPIEERLFGLWSMRAIRLGDLGAERAQHLILKHSISSSFKPNMMTPKQCLDFFTEFLGNRRVQPGGK